jgi:hypothetical protein
MINFSISGYKKLLQLIISNSYDCILFARAANVRENSSFTLLRHDIDVSIEFAYQIAKLEADVGLKSTFFVMLRSPMYNLWSRYNTALLWKIRDLGHDIGLHFDAEFSQQSEEPVEQQIAFEVQTLSTLAKAPVQAFSLHQPTQEIIAQQISIDGLVNTYHPDHIGAFEYISDSNRDWRGKDIESVLSEAKQNVQILTHPMWWASDGQTTQDCWDDAITRNFAHEQKQILETERAYGTKRTMLLKYSALEGGG